MKRGAAIFLMVIGCWGAWAQVPTISSFTPTTGPVGTAVTITGTNFSGSPSSNIVFFGATQAVVTSASTTQLSVTVPAGVTSKPISVATGALKTYSAAPFIVTFPGGQPVGSSSFPSSTSFSPGDGPLFVTTCDLDGDGKAEVITATNNSNNLVVFRNAGTPGSINASTLGAGVNFSTGAFPRGFDVEDLDGDGKPDIAVANSSPGTVSVFRNTSSPGSINAGSLASKVDFGSGNYAADVAIGDLDKDGKSDLAIVYTNDASISVLRNTSSPGTMTGGSFSSSVNFTTGASPLAIALADIDGDGRMDMIAVNSIGNSVSVFRNTSTPGSISAGSFASRVDFATGDNPQSISVGDLDGDGKPDLVVACYTTTAISILRNTSTPGAISSGSFAAHVDLSTSTGSYDAIVTDFDGDGKLDITASTDNANHISIFKNQATAGTLNAGSFGGRIDFSVGPFPYSLAAGDLDNDGKPELIASNFPSDVIAVAHNKVLAPEPSVQPPGPITFSHVTSTTFNGAFAESNPTPDGYVVVVSANAAPTFVPVDGIPYLLTSVGTVGGNTMYVVQNSSEPGFNLTGLTTGDQVNVKVYAFNGTGPTINYLTTSPLTGFKTPVLDTDKPGEAANATPTSVVSGADLVFSGNFTDASSGVDYVQVQYRPITGVAPNNFQTLNMLATTGSTFEATLSAAQVGELGVEYKYLVTDFEGNTNAVDQVTRTTRVRYDLGLDIPYPNPGVTIQYYRIIAVPLILDDKSLNTVIGSTLGPYDPYKWAAYRWTGTRLEELNNDTQVLIGQGYWFITGVNVDPGMNSGPGTTPDVSTSNPFQITLVPGWNQIGNPYNFHISWNDILQANPAKLAALGGASSKIRVYRGTADNVDELVTFEGGFVKNTSGGNITIDIPVTKNPSINSRKAIAGSVHNAIDQPSWEVRFNLSQGELTYNLGGLGMRPDANPGYDEFDDYNLPRFFDYLEVEFPKERVGMTYTKDIVPTAENQVWEFTIESNRSENIFVRWDNSYFGTAKEIVLLDVATHYAVDMRTESEYQFPATASRQFKVIFGNPDFVKNELIPDRAMLFDPYPNPFAGQVSVAYALPSSAVTESAEIGIYNVMGARMSSIGLPNKPGAGSWTWQAEGAVPGIYFVRLRSGNEVVTKKIIKQ